jgi:hypothetical protein
MNHYLDLLVVALADWDSALWQSRVQNNSCTGQSLATKIDISCCIIHFAYYRSVYEQTFTCDCSILSNNIPLSEILGQATYRIWYNILTHSVLLFLISLIPPFFHCSNHHQHIFSLVHWSPCWWNQSGNIFYGTNNLVLWGNRSVDAIVQLYIEFILCLIVLFT